MSRHIPIPLPVVVLGVVSLTISLLCHITSFVLHNELLGAKGSPSTPSFPIQVHPASLTTVKSERFGLYTNNSDWEAILPNGAGFFYHPDDGEHYLLAHYHQLHCLRSLRHYLRLSMVSNQTVFSKMDVGHVDHCLIYLRQMALCNVDLTLEPASHKQRTPDGRVTNAVTGVGITHECRDWEQVWTYMEDNYSKYKDTYEGAI